MYKLKEEKYPVDAKFINELYKQTIFQEIQKMKIINSFKSKTINFDR